MAVLRALVRPELLRYHRRQFHDYIRFETQGGSARIPLNSPNVIGAATSRGTRRYQEDYHAFVGLSLDPEELRISARSSFGIDWDPAQAGACARQAVFVGLYDGHGGSAVSQYLRQELHGVFEKVDRHDIPEVIDWVHEIGGYFKRYDGGPLKQWVMDGPIEAGTMEGLPPLDLASRATLAFFTADRALGLQDAHSCGATASVVMMHSLDSPQPPFFLSKKLALTVAHVGDTRAVLCSTLTGHPHVLTRVHHPEARAEAIRLRRSPGSAMITDSFGEIRFMGALANTRCLGDLRYKPFGVTPEPEITTKLLENGEWAFIIMVSDGISSVVSDAEMCGIARNARTPKDAAAAILSFAEEMGSEDNGTALVLPLAGWGQVQGPDHTEELRKYRQVQMIGSERQRRM